MRSPFRVVVLPIALACLLGASLLHPSPVSQAAGCEVTGPAPGEERLPAEQRAVLHVVRQLPLEVKLGQLLMMGFVGTQPDAGLLDRAGRGHVGGFFLLGRNVRDAAQVRDLTLQLSRAAADGSAGVLPFVATDFEGGTVNALRAITGGTPSASALASAGVAGVEARGTQDATILTSLGFNVNLAPVADVLSSRSDVIGSRAFSTDPEVATALSRAYLRGLQKGNVIGVMKHFPGHGATAGDSHVLLPQVARSLQQLEAADLQPYRQAIAAGEVQAVMVGHLLVPALDPEQPTSLSRATIAGLLRDRLQFDGLVMTDELKMGAIAGRYAPAQAALLAVQAGGDVILADYTAAEQDAVLQALVRACLAGQIPAGRVEQSAGRVLRLKLAHGLAGPEIARRYTTQLSAFGGPSRGARAAGQATPTPARPATASGGPPASRVQLGGVALPPGADGAAGRWYAEGTGASSEQVEGAFGYVISNAGSMAFWEAYADGGPARFGYPISQRFELDGATFQATQRALLRWDPVRLTATPANALELFERGGALLGWPGCDALPAESSGERPEGAVSAEYCSLSAWLEERGVPAAIADDGSGGDFRRAVATRLGWLEHDALRAAFLADPAGGPAAPWPGASALAGGLDGIPDREIPWGTIERYGLPMSRPERFGPFLAQRFQRGVLQLWLDEVPGMPAPGTVTPVLAGELLRAAGLIPAPALIPVALDGSPGSPPPLAAPPAPPMPAVPAAAATPPAPPPTMPTPVSVQPTPTRMPAPAPLPSASPTQAATAAPQPAAPSGPAPTAQR